MPNQINSENSNQNLLSEQSQAWLEAVTKLGGYCHYFAVTFADDDRYPMGNWNAPFFSIEEAKAFKDQVQAEHPNREFFCIEGMLCTDSAMREAPNHFWKTWMQKHEQRINALCSKEA